MIGKEFFIAGSAIFTVSLPDGNHYTFKIKYVEPKGRWNENWFVSLLVGPDNWRNYKTFGMLNPETGGVKLTHKTSMNSDSYPVKLVRRVLHNIWQGTAARITDAGFNVHHTGKCGRCGRMLTVPESIETGLGPVCATKM